MISILWFLFMIEDEEPAMTLLAKANSLVVFNEHYCNICSSQYARLPGKPPGNMVAEIGEAQGKLCTEYGVH